MGGRARPEVIALSLFVWMTSKEFSDEDEGPRTSGDFFSVKSKLDELETKNNSDHLPWMLPSSSGGYSLCCLFVLRAAMVLLSS